MGFTAGFRIHPVPALGTLLYSGKGIARVSAHGDRRSTV